MQIYKLLSRIISSTINSYKGSSGSSFLYHYLKTRTTYQVLVLIPFYYSKVSYQLYTIVLRILPIENHNQYGTFKDSKYQDDTFIQLFSECNVEISFSNGTVKRYSRSVSLITSGQPNCDYNLQTRVNHKVETCNNLYITFISLRSDYRKGIQKIERIRLKLLIKKYNL